MIRPFVIIKRDTPAKMPCDVFIVKLICFCHGIFSFPFCPSALPLLSFSFTIVHGRERDETETPPLGQARRGNGSSPPSPLPPTTSPTVDGRPPPGQFPRSQSGVLALPADAGAAPSAGWRRTCQILSKGTYCCCGGNLTVPNRLDETRLV